MAAFAACVTILFVIAGFGADHMSKHVVRYFGKHLNKEDENHAVVAAIACMAISYYSYFLAIVFIITSMVLHGFGN